MAQYSTKVLSNQGANSSITDGGDRGYSDVVTVVQWDGPTTNATVTGIPIFIARVPSTVVGVGVAQKAAASNSITYTFSKVPVATAVPVEICSTQPAIASNAGTFPVQTLVTTVNGKTNTVHTVSSGVTDPVLSTTLSTLQLAQGDALTIGYTASGSSVALAGATVWVREDNGAY